MVHFKKLLVKDQFSNFSFNVVKIILKPIVLSKENKFWVLRMLFSYKHSLLCLAISFEVGAFFIAFVNGEISNYIYVSNTKCSHLFTLIITKVLNTVKGKKYLSLHCEKNKKRGRAWPILNQISIRKVFYFRCCTGILNANYQFKHYDENIHS